MSDWRQRRKKQSVATHYDSKFSLHVQLYFNVFLPLAVVVVVVVVVVL